MFEKLLDKAAVLDLRIDEMSAHLVKKHKLLGPAGKELEKNPEKSKLVVSTCLFHSLTVAALDLAEGTEESQVQTELASIAIPTQETTVVAGRVCVDAVGDGKLNPMSVVLEVNQFRETSL